MITTTVACSTWLRPGHSTFFSSPHDSRTKRPRGCASRRPVCCFAGWADGLTCCCRARARWLTFGCSAAGLAPSACSRRARRCWRVWRATLARLPVRRMTAAPAAVLLDFQTVRRVPLRLVRLVVAALALGAREGDADSDSGCHVLLSDRGERARRVAAAGLEPATRGL